MDVQWAKLSILSLQQLERIELVDWMESVLAGRPVSAAQYSTDLHVELLKLASADLAALLEWTISVTYKKQPERVGDVIVRAIRAIGDALEVRPGGSPPARQ